MLIDTFWGKVIMIMAKQVVKNKDPPPTHTKPTY